MAKSKKKAVNKKEEKKTKKVSYLISLTVEVPENMAHEDFSEMLENRTIGDLTILEVDLVEDGQSSFGDGYGSNSDLSGYTDEDEDAEADEDLEDEEEDEEEDEDSEIN